MRIWKTTPGMEWVREAIRSSLQRRACFEAIVADGEADQSGHGLEDLKVGRAGPDGLVRSPGRSSPAACRHLPWIGSDQRTRLPPLINGEESRLALHRPRRIAARERRPARRAPRDGSLQRSGPSRAFDARWAIFLQAPLPGRRLRAERVRAARSCAASRAVKACGLPPPGGPAQRPRPQGLGVQADWPAHGQANRRSAFHGKVECLLDVRPL